MLPSITRLQTAYRQGEFTIEDEVARQLARIEASQKILSAYVSWDTEAALAQARRQDERLREGTGTFAPLHGITVSVKDIIDVAGMRTSGCSHSRRDAAPAVTDALVVQRLRAAGAIILGKANCHEFAFGGPSFDLPVPPATNPWKVGYFPGGSSSGSGTSVAGDLCHASLGTDTAGSIRLPSTHCGLTGLKPTYGTLGLEGVCALSLTLDHAGPLARSVTDCERIHQVLRPGYRPRTGDAAHPWRVAVPLDDWGLQNLLRPEVAQMFAGVQERLARAGIVVCPVSLPDLQALHVASAIIMMAEVAYVFGPQVRAHFEDYGRIFRNRILVGERIEASSYLQACQDRLRLTAEMAAALNGMDALLLPGAAAVAGPLAEVDTFYFLQEANLNAIANLTGQPALALPSALSAGDVPMGIQLLGRHHEEAALFSLGRAVERVLAFEGQPELFSSPHPCS